MEGTEEKHRDWEPKTDQQSPGTKSIEKHKCSGGRLADRPEWGKILGGQPSDSSSLASDFHSESPGISRTSGDETNGEASGEPTLQPTGRGEFIEGAAVGKSDEGSEADEGISRYASGDGIGNFIYSEVVNTYTVCTLGEPGGGGSE